jgi:hypothetical protein
VALLLLTPQRMPEPRDETEQHSERRVVYETVSASSTRGSGITIGIIVVIALALVIWILMKVT